MRNRPVPTLPPASHHLMPVAGGSRRGAFRAVVSTLVAALVTSTLATVGCKDPPPTTPPVVTAEPRAVAEPTAAKRAYPDPPPPGPMVKVGFPEVVTFGLRNGLTVHVVENHEVPMVSAQLAIRCGTMDQAYVADFTAAMLGEGTKTRTKAQLDDAIEFVGASMGRSAQTHVTLVSTQVLSSDLKLGMTLMADQVMHPVFPDSALAKLKAQAKSSLRLTKANAGELADVLIDHIAYPEGHPYGRPLWTEDQIDAITLDEVERFHDTFYRANNAFLILAGDITEDDAKELSKRVFEMWEPAKASDIPPNPLNRFTDYAPATSLVVHVVDRPGSPQAEVRVGNLAIARNHPDWAKLRVARQVLGADASGRLFMDIREERGLTYRIFASLSDGQAPGLFEITTSTRNEGVGALLEAILGHIDRIRTETPAAVEVDRAKARIVGALPLDLETPSDIASRIATGLVFNLPSDYWKTYAEAIEAIEASDVEAVARKYIHGTPHIVVVGAAEAIVPQVKDALEGAEVKLYDAELRPK